MYYWNSYEEIIRNVLKICSSKCPKDFAGNTSKSSEDFSRNFSQKFAKHLSSNFGNSNRNSPTQSSAKIFPRNSTKFPLDGPIRNFPGFFFKNSLNNFFHEFFQRILRNIHPAFGQGFQKFFKKSSINFYGGFFIYFFAFP